MANTSMLHVRIDNELKDDAAKTLANIGLTLSDAVRILLTRITKEGGLPVGLTVDPEAHKAWFEAQVMEALTDTKPTASHQEVMDDVQTMINKKHKYG
ncbi:type II toxin-antitoxin system RelB/DinJ family antitoxin [Facilibium subflavum]|uniref:type II toxin-antitoxin system RelB/DinJ family antitoxin n=1 Tax=Facilibium subflavum TaxID=2219058 RepID=UPI000E650BA9|nr:type II toxin-antitoxin system RelB/DinJ family antitoxin [Facilibium subflavum]